MSEAALLQAVRDKLQTVLGLTADSCEVMFDGMPTPSCGELYVAVHPASWAGHSGDWDLDESFGAAVTVTRRLGAIPRDRWGREIVLGGATGAGFDAICRLVVANIHKQNDVMAAANAYLTPEPVGTVPPWEFCEPLVFQGADPRPVERGPDWFSAEPPDSDLPGAPVDAGVSRTLTFGGARRIQGPADGGLT